MPKPDPSLVPPALLEPPAQYRAPAWLPNAHAQTIYPALFAHLPRVRYRRERWDTPDGDFIELDWLDRGHEHAPLVVLFHGLEGGSHGHYARTLMNSVRSAGWRGVVVHFRGCGGAPNLLPRAYHAGDATEIDWVVERMKQLAGDAPMFAAGVSLGGNALLRWLGLNPSRSLAMVTAAAAVSAPLDLLAAGAALETGFNRIYTKQFLRTLKRKSAGMLARHPGLFDGAAMLRSRTLREFDDVVTAPLHGFRDADDYWTQASSKQVLPRIEVPTLVLNARNDPFLPAHALPRQHEVAAAVELEFPDEGGHVGFMTGPFPGRLTWLPARLMYHFARSMQAGRYSNIINGHPTRPDEVSST